MFGVSKGEKSLGGSVECTFLSIIVCLQVIFSITSLFQMISVKIQYQTLIEYVSSVS